MTKPNEDIICEKTSTLTINGYMNHITFPSAIKNTLGLKNHDKIRWVLYKDNTIHLSKVEEGAKVNE